MKFEWYCIYFQWRKCIFSNLVCKRVAVCLWVGVGVGWVVMGWGRMLIQCKDEVRAWSLTSIEIPIVELGRSYYRLISTMWFPILVRRHLYIESGPRCQYVYHLSNHSLPNTSNDIRWSMDLRWQSPFEKWGFYDIAEGVRFRSSTDPDVKPDWKKFLSVNRKKIWQERHCKGVSDHWWWTYTFIWLTYDDIIEWEYFPGYWPFVRGIHRSRWIPRTKASDAELWCFLWSAPE